MIIEIAVNPEVLAAMCSHPDMEWVSPGWSQEAKDQELRCTTCGKALWQRERAA